MRKFEFTVKLESQSFNITFEAKDEVTALSAIKLLFPEGEVEVHKPNHIECLNEMQRLFKQFDDAVNSLFVCDGKSCTECNRTNEICNKIKSLEKAIIEYKGY